MEPRLNTWFLGSTWLGTQMASQSVRCLCTAEGRQSLYFIMDRFPQNCPFPCRIWTPSNTRFLGPTRVFNPNGISISSAIFVGLTTVTDHATRSVAIGCICICSTAMRPNNTKHWTYGLLNTTLTYKSYTFQINDFLTVIFLQNNLLLKRHNMTICVESAI